MPLSVCVCVNYCKKRAFYLARKGKWLRFVIILLLLIYHIFKVKEIESDDNCVVEN